MKKVLSLIGIVLSMLFLFSTVAVADAPYNTWQYVNGTYTNTFISDNKVTRTTSQSWNKADIVLSVVTWDNAVSSAYYSYAYPCTSSGTLLATQGIRVYAGIPEIYTLTSTGQGKTQLYTRYAKDSGISSSKSVHVTGYFKAYHD